MTIINPIIDSVRLTEMTPTSAESLFARIFENIIVLCVLSEVTTIPTVWEVEYIARHLPVGEA